MSKTDKPGTAKKRRRRRKKTIPVRWNVPELNSDVELAGWLGISKSTLYWLADPSMREPKGKNYQCHWIRKRIGMRLIESPKGKLKLIQQQILESILNCVPVSHHAHGFVNGRSPVSFVSIHTGSDCCLKMDLKQFFPTVRCGRIVGIFKSLGYPPDVARLLATLCTTTTSRPTLRRLVEHSTAGQELHKLYVRRHLPQGSPASPALSNICAYRMDCRLAGMAKMLDGRYSRYADDLLFSFDAAFGADGQRKNRLKRLAHSVAVIAMEEGFDVNFRKTRFMFQAQRQMATGLVFNEKPNTTRHHFDRIKAILHNCCTRGPDSQNLAGLADFRGHLLGHIHWIGQTNANRSRKLMDLFDKIQW